MARAPARLVSGHASVGERQSPRRSRGPGDPGQRPRAHGRRRGVRGGQGGRRPAVRAHPSPRAAGPLGCRAGASRGPTTARAHGRRGRARAAERLPLGRLRITYTGGPAPLGSGRGDEPPTLVVVAAPMDPAAPTASVAVVPWPRNERGALAGLKTTSYAENVVALAEAQAPRGDGGGVRQPGGQPLRGHRHQRLLRRRRRAPHAHARQSGCLAGITRALLLEWFGGREVDEPIEVLERGQRDLPGRRPRATSRASRVGRPRARGAGSGDGRGAGHLA